MNKLIAVAGIAIATLSSFAAENVKTVNGIKYRFNVVEKNGDTYNFAEWTDSEGSLWNVFRDEDGMDGSVQYCIQVYNNVDDVSERHGFGLWFTKDEMTDEFVQQNLYIYTRKYTDGDLCQIKINKGPMDSWYFAQSGNFAMVVHSRYALDKKRFSDIKEIRVRYDSHGSPTVDRTVVTSGVSKVPEALKNIIVGNVIIKL